MSNEEKIERIKYLEFKIPNLKEMIKIMRKKKPGDVKSIPFMYWELQNLEEELEELKK